ncbi:NAD-dependent epimerase/dehydratase family protein [Paracoccus xiamenensis]|uniref:NAD-dependent epimerase/dehydratase family protein n=1 Tax=Paracoccus xiamenensis TaxID=2714901 RepID=UPI00140BE2BF|nr:NAD(P)-dependent oxidoreductase [Paracoccus xiamenensis]NHF71602.1 NAD(P)-dependent oxidoreductase [Paracoccus xiamenensis]
MRVAVTGGTGLVGRFLVNEALGAGDDVTVMTRSPPTPGFFRREVAHLPYDLSDNDINIRKFDAIVHAAFDHVPGRYRGGEGDDPTGFLARNLDGSLRLFEAAAQAGARVVFISTRAVYGPQDGTLTEDMECRPNTLYGQAKLAAEQALLATGQPATVLRVTGVYGPPGPGQRHKWADLFDDFAAGRRIDPRVGTEVHGECLGLAVRRGREGADGIYNVSDMLLDWRDLLAEWQSVTGIDGRLPERADARGYNQMDTARLQRLGVCPGGIARLRPALRQMAEQAGILPKDA